MSTPDLLASFDERRARRLRSMKRNAAGLLVLAGLVFVATYVFTDGSGWAGYVRAASEAAMVGGIADWFAVTALFRHPLGIPIPHTALIPRGKDAIGKGLGEFVQSNFMNPAALVARIEEADPAGRQQFVVREGIRPRAPAPPRRRRSPEGCCRGTAGSCSPR